MTPPPLGSGECPSTKQSDLTSTKKQTRALLPPCARVSSASAGRYKRFIELKMPLFTPTIPFRYLEDRATLRLLANASERYFRAQGRLFMRFLFLSVFMNAAQFTCWNKTYRRRPRRKLNLYLSIFY